MTAKPAAVRVPAILPEGGRWASTLRGTVAAMALLHRATLSPSKPEVLAAWLPTRPWNPDPEAAVEPVAAYRFDDPEGQVGVEVHLVLVGDVVAQVPFTYRGAPLDGADEHLVTTMEHSALGRRWVYDGLGDPLFVRLVAAAALTGTGQAVALVESDRWAVVPSLVRLGGGGWNGGPVPIDGFVVAADDDPAAAWCVLRNDRIELRVAHVPMAGRATIGLTGTWPGQESPAVLAQVRDLAAP